MNTQHHTTSSHTAITSVQLSEAYKQYLTFMLGAEIFAIGILSIKEIIEYNSLTVVPMMPECVRGVINLRGAVVPVIDLLARFGKPPTLIGRRTCIIIVEVKSELESGDQQDIGIMVDAVNEVLEIAAADIEPAPHIGTKIRSDFIEGMGKTNTGFIILLNVKHVLSTDEVSTLAQIS